MILLVSTLTTRRCAAK